MPVLSGIKGDHMSAYEEIKGRNIIGAVQRLLKAGALEVRMSDGRLTHNFKNSWDTPWVHTKSSYSNNCYLWKDILFENIIMPLLPPGKRFVPSGCMDCYKVVVRPRNIEQLFALEALEKRLGHPSKCGIELRDTVFGNYGGYFYNRGLDEGLDCYHKVRAAVDDDSVLGPATGVFLKRACTEMEHNCGPSDKWEITDAQMQVEDLINRMIITDVPVIVQSEHAKDHVRQTWIEAAYKWGDNSVLEYTGGPLYPEYVTYHHLKREDNNVTERSCTGPRVGYKYSEEGSSGFAGRVDGGDKEAEINGGFDETNG
jgi:hypothetical protein